MAFFVFIVILTTNSVSSRREKEVDKLHKLLREQKSIIRQLQRKLSRSGKGRNKHISEPPEENEPVSFDCPNCQKGDLKTTSIAGRTWDFCNECGWKSKIEKA